MRSHCLFHFQKDTYDHREQKRTCTTTFEGGRPGFHSFFSFFCGNRFPTRFWTDKGLSRRSSIPQTTRAGIGGIVDGVGAICQIGMRAFEFKEEDPKHLKLVTCPEMVFLQSRDLSGHSARRVNFRGRRGGEGTN